MISQVNKMSAQPPNATLPVNNKRYILKYKNEHDQADAVEGTLLHIDVNGFIAFDLQGKMLLVPKDRVLIFREV
jgi:hypothetical protein